jgi:hypothetical protein
MVAAYPDRNPSGASDPALVELIHYSSKAWLKKAEIERSQSSSEPCSDQSIRWNGLKESAIPLMGRQISTAPFHAAPLVPLRDRDIQVLSDLFMQDEIDAIEADIQHNLLQRYPEHCWEDDMSDLLRDCF